jgi:hypothetical protein
MRIIISAIIAAALASASLSVLAKNPHDKGLPPGLQKKNEAGRGITAWLAKEISKGACH